jgi:hypothetical protein
MSFIKLNIKTRVRFAARLPSAFMFYKTSFYDIFSNLHIKYMFFLNKINFANLGNFVTVGDTFISKLIFKFESKLNIIVIFVKLQLKMSYPEIRQLAENTTVNLLPAMCVTN